MIINSLKKKEDIKTTKKQSRKLKNK